MRSLFWQSPTYLPLRQVRHIRPIYALLMSYTQDCDDSPTNFNNPEDVFPQLICDAYHDPDVLVIRCDMKVEVPGKLFMEMVSFQCQCAKHTVQTLILSKGVQRVFTTPVRSTTQRPLSATISEIQVDSALLSPPAPSSLPELSASSTASSSSRSLALILWTPPLLINSPVFSPLPSASISASVSSATSISSVDVNRVLRLLDFSELSFVSAGSFGKVHLVKHCDTRMEVALKTIEKDPEIERSIRNEQRILRELRGTKGVLELLASFHDENNYYLVTVRIFQLKL